jgi:hypothetical protein
VTLTVSEEYQGTLFSLSDVGNVTNNYLPRYATHTSSGASATFTSYWSTNPGVTSSQAQTWYGKAALAGEVTVSMGNLTGESPAVTNLFNVTVIYRR